jgi:poly-gamma-glutamate biosynthesis protein PgsC/CapC
MEELVTLSIALGLVVSLVFSEMLGVAAGGMVVPGYFALHLDNPLSVGVTLIISYLTYFIVHSMSTVTIVYGRRRTVSMILVGFGLGWLLRSVGASPTFQLGALDLTVVGYIIPGLVAIWIDRQGAVETFSSLVTASVVVRLALILVTAGEINP